MFSLPDSPLLDKTRQLARAVAPLNGRALLVGGFVRDALLGQSPKDADVEVYGLGADELKRVLETLGRVDAVGESFRVLKLVWHAKNQKGGRERFELDVSLPRRDRKIGEGHKGFEVEGDPFASIEEAARRRDFTLNAILCDPLTGEILDPFGGRVDLEARVLRAVDALHFGEDSLRVLRAMQFAARFELSIEPETVQTCRATGLDDLPRERVWGEWEKWLLKSKRPSVGLRAGRETGVFSRLFPFLERALERREPEMGAALDRAAKEIEGAQFPEQVALMLAVLGSFLGARDTAKLMNELGVFRLKGTHEAVDVQLLVMKLLSARKMPSDWFRRADAIQAKDFRFFAARVPPQLALKLARSRGFKEAADWFERGLREAGVEFGPPKAFLQGRHLIGMGMKPGPHFGPILERVYFLQLSGEVTTLDEAKEAAQSFV
jgi:tRNA nucleotidyltransferase (CCA-adding enzyme)